MSKPALWMDKKGARKEEIPANCDRSRLNLSGLIDVIYYKVIIQKDETLNDDSTNYFFKKIEDAYQKKNKIHILL